MLCNETILLLTYYYSPNDRDHRVLRHVIKTFCPAYLPWDIYLYQPLKSIFSNVIIYDYLKRRAEIGIEAMNLEIIHLAKVQNVKYVLWTSFHYDVLEVTLDKLRNEGIIVAGWFFDDEWRFENYSKYWAQHLDYCCSCSIEAIRKYQALDFKAIQTITNTGVAKQVDPLLFDEKYDVTFIGTSRLANRNVLLNALRDNGINVEVFGEGSGGYVSFDQMLTIFSQSKINLNFSGAGFDGKVKQIKGRIFQVCLAGGFLLSETAPDIDSYYNVGEEIVCFDSVDEMVRKVRYYLENDQERRKIAVAGWERAKSQYTSERIVLGVFSQIELETQKSSRNFVKFSHQIKMPLTTRTIFPSDYHFQWARAFMIEDSEQSLWKDSINKALYYSPVNFSAWYFKLVGIFPSFVRKPGILILDNSVMLFQRTLRRIFKIPVIGVLIKNIVKKIT